jgi:signal transduction histidine kinase
MAGPPAKSAEGKPIHRIATAAEAPSTVVLTVTDTGCGIPPGEGTTFTVRLPRYPPGWEKEL